MISRHMVTSNRVSRPGLQITLEAYKPKMQDLPTQMLQVIASWVTNFEICSQKKNLCLMS